MPCLFLTVLLGWLWQFLVFKLTFSIQFLKVVLQEQQNFLWWCPVSFAWVLRSWLWIRLRNEQITVINTIWSFFCKSAIRVQVKGNTYFSNIITFGMTRWRWYCFLLNYSSPQLGFVFEMIISLQRRTYSLWCLQATYMYIISNPSNAVHSWRGN